MLPDKCARYDPSLAVLKFIYWLECAYFTHKVHEEECIHSGYVWVYSTESGVNIPEFSLQHEGIRNENNIIAEKKKSTRRGKLIVKIEEKEIEWRNYFLYHQDLNGLSSPPLQQKSCPWRNLALLDIIKSNEVKIKKVSLQAEYQKSNYLTTDLRFALCGTKSSSYLLFKAS